MASIAQFGVLDRQTTNRERWTTFVALFLFGFTASCNLFKASPTLSYIGADLGLDAGGLGLIMTFYSICALIMAYPGALIMRKVGVKAMVVASCAIMVLGTAVSALSTGSGMFLFGRAVEGVAYGLICVCGPNILPRLFPRKQMGIAVGVWSQWIPCGTIIAFFLAPMIFDATGDWRGVWYVSLALGVLALVLLIALVKMPKVNENEIVDGNADVVVKHGKQFFGSALAVCIVFMFWCYLYLVNINGMYPTFLQDVKGMSVFDSSMLPNWLAIITIPVGIFAGVISGRFPIRKWALVVAYVVVGAIFFFLAFTPGTDASSSWAFCVIMGLCASFVPTYTRGIVPVFCTNSFKCDMALGTMAFVTGLAQVAAVVASMSVASIGWFANAQYVCAPLALVAAFCVLVLVKDDRKVVALRAEEDRLNLIEAGVAVDLEPASGRVPAPASAPDGAVASKA